MTHEQRAELRRLAAAATPGEWRWYGNTSGKMIHLVSTAGMRPFVMQFARWGLQNAAPLFRDFAGDFMGKAQRWFIRPQEHNPWLVQGIDHPDARWIEAANPQTVLALLAALDQREARIRELEALAKQGPW